MEALDYRLLEQLHMELRYCKQLDCWMMKLFEVRRRCGIGFPDGDIFDPHPAVGSGVQAGIGLIVKIFCHVLGRRIHRFERFNVIQELVVQTVNDVRHYSLQLLKVVK